MIEIKYDGLQFRPTLAELWSYWRAAPKPPTLDISRVTSIFITVMWTIAIAVFVYASGRQVGMSELGIVMGGMVAGIVIIGSGLWLFQTIRRNIQHVRYELLARDNQLHYIPFTVDPTHNGLIFQRGFDQLATQQFIAPAGRQPFEIGNHSYVIQQGKRTRTYTYGYVRIELDRHLPHMVLDATHNNTRLWGMNIETNLAADFDASQILQLEGDFNEYFTLFAPKGYERDALYIFTPDLMALLIDESHRFDAEIIDNSLYFYSHPFDLSQEPMWNRLLRIIDLVGQKTKRQSDRYVDERAANLRLPDNTVAWEGRRLTGSRTTWVSIVIAIIIFIATYNLQSWLMQV